MTPYNGVKITTSSHPFAKFSSKIPHLILQKKDKKRYKVLLINSYVRRLVEDSIMTKIKPKNKKNDDKGKKGTLDQQHTDRITKFEMRNQSIADKKSYLKSLEQEFQDLKVKNAKKITHEDIRRRSELKDLINKTKMEIHNIENCVDQLEYIVATCDILINYYDNKELVDNTHDEDLVHEPDDKTSSRKNILSYFMSHDKKEEPTPVAQKIPLKSAVKKAGSKTSKKQVKVTIISDTQSEDDAELPKSEALAPKKLTRATLYDEYLTVIDNTHPKKTKQRQSNLCDCLGEKVLNQTDGCFVCKSCGDVETILIGTEKPNYKEPTQDSGTYAYKRINHLTEILSQLQAKESTDIPPKVFDNVNREIKKRKINKDDLDMFSLRKILKKLTYRKYYEHAPHMLQIINGKEPPNFTRKDEMRIKKMFKDIQKPFTLYCPKDRKNFLNYSYVLHKFCELLELDDYLEYFPLLKNTTKLKQHDKIWKNICKHMRWKYYKSI